MAKPWLLDGTAHLIAPLIQHGNIQPQASHYLLLSTFIVNASSAGVDVVDSQSTRLLKKKREMREVDDAMAAMVEQHRSRLDQCALRAKGFEAKQAEMKDQVARFEKFIQENDDKRARAEAKAKQVRASRF